MLPFSVTILGSSSALPTETRFPTSQVVSLNESLYLIDCGEGTQIQMRKFGIKAGKINHIFISYLQEPWLILIRVIQKYDRHADEK